MTWVEMKAELLDRERHLEKRRHLMKEAMKGYFHDFYMLEENGGKMWIGPEVLIRGDKAMYFPNMKGTTLDKGAAAHTTDLCRGKISVVGITSTEIGGYHTASFIQQVLEAYEEDKQFRYVQVRHPSSGEHASSPSPPRR